MHMDPIVPILTGTVLAILLVALALHKLKIPYVVAYLLVGVIIGPFGLGLVKDHNFLNKLESIGVFFLLFFVGMEINLPRFVKNWKIPVIGTIVQVIISVLVIALIGFWFQWSLSRIILLGFVTAISSTAVVLKILNEWKELDTDLGQRVLGILLVQDVLLIPMMITIDLLGGQSPNPLTLSLQITGGLFIVGLLIWLTVKKDIHLPFGETLKNNHEIQVFAALTICFGLGFLTELFHLSGALGAFIAGIIVGTAKETDWVYGRLEPFYVLFVALFFVSIGMLLDLKFFVDNWEIIILIVFSVILVNTFINMIILKLGCGSWRRSFYGGALLSQIGEFSFVLIAVGKQAGVIADFGYQITISVISITLLSSPAWISLAKLLQKKEEVQVC